MFRFLSRTWSVVARRTARPALFASITITPLLAFTGLATAQTATVSVTHTQALVSDADGDGRASAGDTIEYTVTIRNTSTVDVQNLVATLGLDPNTTLVPGSIQTLPLAVTDTVTVTEDTVVSTSLNLLSNDAGQDAGETLQVLNVAGSSSPGTLTGTYGSLTWAANGSATYVLNNGSSAVQQLDGGEVVTETFTYQMTDGTSVTDIDSVVIRIVGTNDAPSVSADTYQAFNNQPITVDAAHGVLANDSDADVQTLVVSSFSGTTSNGNSVSVAADGSFTFTGTLTTGQADTFTYTARDPNGATTNGTATLVGIGRVLFVNNTAAPGGTGTLSAPFNSLGLAIDGMNQANDIVYVFRGDGTNTGLNQSYQLSADDMQVLGQGVALSLNGVVQVASGQAPLLRSTSMLGSIRLLNLDATIRGILFDNNDVTENPGISAFYDDGGTHTLTIADSTFTNTDRGVELGSAGSGTTVTASIASSVFDSNIGDAINVDTQGTSNIVLNLTTSQVNTSARGLAIFQDGSTVTANVTSSNFIGNADVGINVATVTSSSATSVLNLSGSVVMTGNNVGVSLTNGSGSSINLNVLPSTGSNNSVTNNITGVCNHFGQSTLNINPGSQVSGNTGTDIDTGGCGG